MSAPAENWGLGEGAGLRLGERHRLPHAGFALSNTQTRGSTTQTSASRPVSSTAANNIAPTTIGSLPGANPDSFQAAR